MFPFVVLCFCNFVLFTPMLPSINRLKGEHTFSKVYKQGRKLYSPYFLLFVLESPSINELPTKFGFVASKKVGKAVIRNRARRLLSEVVRLQLPDLKENFQIIVVASPKIIEADLEMLQSNMGQLLQKASIYKIQGTRLQVPSKKQEPINK